MRSSTAFLASCLAHLAIAAPIPVIRVLSSSIPPPTVQGYHHPPASLVVGASEACEQDRLAIDNLPITPPATASPDVALDVPVPIHTTYLLSLYRHHRMQNAEVERALREEFCQIHGTTVPVQYAGIGAGWGDAGRIFPCRHVARLRHDTQHRHVFVVFGAACLFLLLLATEAWMYLPLRIRQVFIRQGIIRLEVDEQPSRSPSFRCDACSCSHEFHASDEKANSGDAGSRADDA